MCACAVDASCCLNAEGVTLHQDVWHPPTIPAHWYTTPGPQLETPFGTPPPTAPLVETESIRLCVFVCAAGARV